MLTCIKRIEQTRVFFLSMEERERRCLLCLSSFERIERISVLCIERVEGDFGYSLSLYEERRDNNFLPYREEKRFNKENRDGLFSLHNSCQTLPILLFLSRKKIEHISLTERDTPLSFLSL